MTHLINGSALRYLLRFLQMDRYVGAVRVRLAFSHRKCGLCRIVPLPDVFRSSESSMVMFHKAAKHLKKETQVLIDTLKHGNLWRTDGTLRRVLGKQLGPSNKCTLLCSRQINIFPGRIGTASRKVSSVARVCNFQIRTRRAMSDSLLDSPSTVLQTRGTTLRETQ